MTNASMRGQKWINILQTAGIAVLMLVLVYYLGRQLLGGIGFVFLAMGFIALQVFRNPSGVAGAIPMGPADAPELYAISDQLAARAGLQKLPRLYLLPSPLPNAFTIGTKDGAQIFITHALAQRLSRREMAGVLAHEISHIRANDLLLFRFAELVRRSATLMSRFGWLLILFAVPLLLFSGGALPLGLFAALIGAPVVSLVLELALFRTREFSADLGAVELTGDPEGLASALYKIERPNGDLLSVLFPVPKRQESGLLRTHPATDQRIRRLNALAGRR